MNAALWQHFLINFKFLYRFYRRPYGENLFLDQTNNPLYIKLYDAVVGEIKAGILLKDNRMPSVRLLAKSMNISRNTVESAYAQLIAEGYLYSIPKKGNYVSGIEDKHLPGVNLVGDKGVKARSEGLNSIRDRRPIKYDFVSEYVEPEKFNMVLWKKSLLMAMNKYEADLYRYASPFGEEALKEAICDFFSRTRGIVAGPDQIIIGSGSSMLLGTLASFLKERDYKRFYIDEPGFTDARDVFYEMGYDLEGLPVRDMLLNTEILKEKGKGILFTSPSYQFPYGEILPVGKRLEALNWARETDSYIIEDDYNNELRYEGKPVPALQGLTHDQRVIYLGAFSTMLIPSIRISFLVLPGNIVNDYKSGYSHKVQTASKLEQLALAEMIRSGLLAKHMRKLKAGYRHKNQLLRELLEEHFKEIATWHIPKAGVSCLVQLKKEVDMKALESLSYERNVNICGISTFMAKKAVKPLEKNLVLNYRGIKERDLESGIIELKELICRLY